jgi:MoaA/NifB/PqqE/SkfB family radical SAM enzyme
MMVSEEKLDTDLLPWSYPSGPGVYDIKVGYTCNNRCRHCAVDWVQSYLAENGQRKDLTTEEIQDYIDHAHGMSAQTIVLTGGETTIRPDFEHVVHYAIERRLSLIIHTNGRAFVDGRMAERVATVPGIAFLVSLHASKAEIHDQITCRCGSFDEACEGIRNLSTHCKQVGVKLVLLKDNRNELTSTMHLAHQLGATEFCVAFPYAVQHQLEGVPRYGDIGEEIKTGCKKAHEIQMPLTFETIPYCIVPDQPLQWKQNYDLQRARPCRPGRPNTRSRSDIGSDWDLLRPAMKVKRSSCRSCVFDQVCEGPWNEYVQEFGFSEFIPVLPEQVTSYLLAMESSQSILSDV